MSKRKSTIRQMTEKYGIKNVHKMTQEDCKEAICALTKEIARLDHMVFDMGLDEEVADQLMVQRCDYAQLRGEVRDRLSQLKPKTESPYKLYITTYRIVTPETGDSITDNACSNAIRDALAYC